MLMTKLLNLLACMMTLMKCNSAATYSTPCNSKALYADAADA